MKKFLAFILCAVLAVNCSALSVGNSTYDYIVDNSEISIIFESASELSAEKQQQIAHHLVYGDDGSSTYAWCWLTGHDIVTQNVIEIEHKVSTLSPRCRRTIYSVDTCTKCDYIDESVLSQTLIACCPEE